VSFLRLLGLGLRDVFEQLLTLSLFSLLWWACQITIVLGPPATVTLFSMADPRRQTQSPEFSDSIAVMKTAFRRGWGVFLWTVPLIVILIWNTFYFAGTEQALRVLIPLWLLMSIILIVLSTYAFSVAGTMESGVRNAFRGAAYVLVSRPFRALLLCLLLIMMSLVMTVTVIPMLFLGPATIAAIVNRFVLDGLNVHVIDPNSPTDERAYERERGINPDKGLLQRMRGSNTRR
jgi:uncharacterized membrane protein YesL